MHPDGVLRVFEVNTQDSIIYYTIQCYTYYFITLVHWFRPVAVKYASTLLYARNILYIRFATLW